MFNSDVSKCVLRRLKNATAVKLECYWCYFSLGVPPDFMSVTVLYAPVICIPGSPGAGDSGNKAGLKCRALTSDVSRQCRGFAGVMISRQYTIT